MFMDKIGVSMYNMNNAGDVVFCLPFCPSGFFSRTAVLLFLPESGVGSAFDL